MDKRVLRERMRRKKRQMMIRRYMKMGMYAVGSILAVVFVIKGIILPIVHRVGSGGTETVSEVRAQTAEADPNAAVRQPLKGQGDVGKTTVMTPGWHEDETGRWYQNADGTYYAGGFQDIDGVTYSFDDNGYIQTGWVSKGVNDYYFNDDGSYNSEKIKPRLALTFDDGPGQYTDQLLDCLEENGAHATFFMQGINVGGYQDTVKRMVEIGCELGNHSWNHLNYTQISLDDVMKQIQDTDNALIEACGQASTVARAPYGAANQDIFNTVGKPFFMWSLDTMDWSTLNEQMDYDAVMNGDLTDGSIILMHDIHEPSVKAALRLIPDLIAQGYKLVTVSELAEAKGVTLQNAQYVDFWDSSLASGIVAGYNANNSDNSSDSSSSDGSDYSDGSEDYSDGSGDYGDGSGDYSDDGGDYSDGSEDYSDDYSDGDY